MVVSHTKVYNKCNHTYLLSALLQLIHASLERHARKFVLLKQVVRSQRRSQRESGKKSNDAEYSLSTNGTGIAYVRRSYPPRNPPTGRFGGGTVPSAGLTTTGAGAASSKERDVLNARAWARGAERARARKAAVPDMTVVGRRKV
jgi:hypothetical protein